LPRRQVRSLPGFERKCPRQAFTPHALGPFELHGLEHLLRTFVDLQRHAYFASRPVNFFLHVSSDGIEALTSISRFDSPPSRFDGPPHIGLSRLERKGISDFRFRPPGGSGNCDSRDRER
jgi:hypothetical protein